MKHHAVYIAGKMTGLPDKGRGLFTKAEEVMSAFGWRILNPAMLPDGLAAEKYMPICMAMIDACDVLMLLPGWTNSPGAKLEAQYATYQGIPVHEVESLVPFRASPMIRRSTEAETEDE
ncbi:MAG: DUF4406 domain-containing protein [Clostridiales bacterium]|nr:DUF4406 domain-containing protein [Clostridiales bacterium]